jgi:hypothetical protein
MLVGIALGLYAGIWRAFIGGIVQVIDGVKAADTDALSIALGIFLTALPFLVMIAAVIVADGLRGFLIVFGGSSAIVAPIILGLYLIKKHS